MSCITRCVMRWGLISGLALGGLTLLVGPERVAAGLAQVRSKAQGVVDQVVDDPVALRRQLENLADDYPERIAEVKGELAAVNRQLEMLVEDIQVSANVITSASEDVVVLQNKIDRAEKTRLVDGNADRKVFIRFDGLRFSVDDARGEQLRVDNIRETFADRLAMEREELTMLEEQKSRLNEILGKLEDDFNTYQSQLWALDRQIDAIERNDRLIELMEEQQETLSSYDRFSSVGNLQQIHGRLAELRAIQEAQMEAMRKKTARNDYEQKARMELRNQERENTSDLDGFFDEADESEGEVEATTTKGSVAWAPPIVID